jgi:hypothetical protein
MPLKFHDLSEKTPSIGDYVIVKSENSYALAAWDKEFIFIDTILPEATLFCNVKIQMKCVYEDPRGEDIREPTGLIFNEDGEEISSLLLNSEHLKDARYGYDNTAFGNQVKKEKE